MPASIFTKDEKAFFASYLEGWNRLGGAGKERDDEGELFSPKDQYIDKVIQDFFEEFPERDVSRAGSNPRAFPMGIRDSLHTRVRRFLYNGAAAEERKVGGRKSKQPFSKNLNFYSLFKQKFREEILKRRAEITSSTDPVELLRAYNTAVDEEQKYQEQVAPEGLRELESMARNLRSMAARPFHEQSADVQDTLLGALPGEIGTVMKEWERRTNACLYIMGCWSDSSGNQSAFDYTMRNCKGYLKTEQCQDAQHGWQEWVRENHGARFNNNIAEAVPSVWPNAQGLPMMPLVLGPWVPMDQQKRLCRRYLTCWSISRGGCQLPYTKIEIDMREEPGSWIEERQMPPGVKILRDMCHWTCAELNGWLSLFIASQSGDLPPDRRFEMTQVPQKGSRPPKNIQGQPLPHVDAWEYGWTSDELLYAQRMTSHPEGNIQHEEHHGLPPARRSHIYSPFRLDLFEALISTHAEHPGMIALIKEVVCMETDSPAHAAIGLCEIDPPGNPHVPRATEHSLSNSLQPAPWLTAAFYNPTSPNHLRWSIKTLQDWVLVCCPHIHRLSNTVYGGPLGIRVLVFACSRILQNLDCAGSGRPAPRELSRHFDRPMISSMMHSAVELVSTLRTQVAASRATLQRSSGARAELWEREVLIRLEQRVDSVEHSESEYRVSTTSGVPGDFRVLEEMAAYIKQQPNRDGPHQADPDSDNEEFEVASRRATKRAAVEQSMEMINITAEMGSFHSTDDEAEQAGPVLLQELTNANPPTSLQTNEVTEDLDSQLTKPDGVDQPALTRRKSGRRVATKPGYAEAIAELKKSSYRRC